MRLWKSDNGEEDAFMAISERKCVVEEDIAQHFMCDMPSKLECFLFVKDKI